MSSLDSVTKKNSILTPKDLIAIQGSPKLRYRTATSKLTHIVSYVQSIAKTCTATETMVQHKQQASKSCLRDVIQERTLRVLKQKALFVLIKKLWMHG